MIGFLITVGPGEGDIAISAITSILHFYPGSKTWIRDDATTDGTFEKLRYIAAANPERIDLARNPFALGFTGIPVSIFRSYVRISQAPERLEMIIQLDPDVWLRDGIVELARAKFAEQGPGIIGSYRFSASRSTRSHRSHRRNMVRDLLPLGIDRETKTLRFGLPFYTKFLLSAFRNGYRLGHHVLAAFYIMHSETLYELRDKGFWKAMPDTGARNVKEDDPLVSLGAFIVGHKLIELHDGLQQRVWIQLREPLPMAAKVIYTDYVAVHPLKSTEASLAIRSELAALMNSL